MHYSKTLQCLKSNGHILAVERHMLPKFYKGLRPYILLPSGVPFAKYQEHSRVELVYSL
jgi:hypothetical protein